MKFQKSLLAASISAFACSSAWATNGMNLEGYGPEALGMGGAAYAYDNGTAAVMNNPATIGLMEEDSRLDIALGFLGPDIDVTTDMGGGPMTAKSGGDAYWMPAAGYARKNGNLTYGIGVYAQGGMGTEYKGNTFMAGMFGEDSRSELTHGRAVLPLAYNVNDQLTVGGSLDLVWAGLDLIMPMTAGQMGVAGVSMSGTMAPMMGALNFGNNPMDSAQFNFSNGSDFSGKARGYGVAGKLGLAFKASDKVTLGVTYHSETNLSDLESDATIGMAIDQLPAGWGGDDTLDGTMDPADFGYISMPGKIKVVDFQWPATYGIGAAFQATDRLMIAADVKRINWSDTMKNFKLSFRPDGGGNLDITMPTNWDDQTVVALGLAYKVSDPLTVRVGFNRASNPIPDSTLNPYFPATIEKHYTAGLSYQFSDNGAFHFAASYAPEVKATNPGGTIPDYATVPPAEITHSQLNWQAMLSFNF